MATISEIQKKTSPNPFALLTTRKEDGSANVMAVSWWTYVTNNPPMIAVSLSQKGFSGKRILAEKEFGLSIVTEAVREAALACGTCSGGSVDKAAKFGLALTSAQVIGAPLVRDSRATLECRLHEAVPLTDHTLYVAEVVAMHTPSDAPQLFALEGYARLGTVKEDV